MESFINHADARKDIPPDVMSHLRGLISQSRLPDTEDTLKKLIEAWLLKKAAFQRMADHANFPSARILRRDDAGGCLALTLSGSLITVGPPAGGLRDITYSSLGLRTDVPETLVVRGARLARDVECGRPLVLEDGTLEKTSAVMDLALTAAAGERPAGRLRKADEKLKGDFVRFNRQALEEEGDDVLRRRDDLFQKWIIIQWFLFGGLARHVFLARAKILWIELFTRIYHVLAVEKSDPAERDRLFLEFTNVRFAKFCDEYKWYESERKNFDIGLMRALEELPDYGAYLDFVDEFCRSL